MMKALGQEQWDTGFQHETGEKFLEGLLIERGG